MKKILPKISYGMVLFVFLVTLTSQSSLAANLDFSKGVMPDSPFYQLDLNLEKINLISAGEDNQKQAQLHLQYGTERLNELDYLAEKNDFSLDNIVTISDEYQKNISKFSKLISQDETITSEKKANDLSPQIDQLQAIQTKVVSKINEQPAQEEVKIIVKSTIQESQMDLMQAVVSVKKPIEEKVVSEQTSTTEAVVQSDEKETVKKLDETIIKLNEQKNQLAAEIKEDEKSLKVKKEIADNQPIVNIDNTTPENKTENSTSNQENPVNPISKLSLTDSTEENKILSEDSNISTDFQPSTPETTTLVIQNQWYYSPTCDYISDKPGKDPVCGEEMIPISSLPKEHSFFTKYIYKDGKYVQNVNDITLKKENDILKQAETPIVVTPADTITTENIPTTTPEQAETTEDLTVT